MSERTVQGHELVELVRWLQTQIDEKRSRVVLRERSSTKDERVQEWRLERAIGSELATAIFARASDDAKHQRGIVRYGLFAYFDGQKQYADRIRFCIGEPEPRRNTALATLDAPADDDEEIALERGQRVNVTGLLMRHTHASVQLSASYTHELIRHYKEELKRADARIRELEERELKRQAMEEERLSLKHEREREMEKFRAESTEKRKDQLFEKLEMLVPIAMSKVMPAGKTPALGEELMRQLLKSLNRVQLEALTGHLAPEQQALIYEIYVAYGQREEQRQEERAAKKRTNGNHGTNGSASSANGSHA